MTDKYGRTYTPQYAVCKLVRVDSHTWTARFHGVDEHDTYESASSICARKQLKAPNERYVVVEVRYYYENAE